MKRRLWLSVLAGLVLFVWGFVSWAILPWHMTVANQFLNEAAVSQVLKQNAPRPGVYYLPFEEQNSVPGQGGAFANVLPGGMPMDMGSQLSIGVLTQVLSAFLVLSLLAIAGGGGFGRVVAFFALVGLIVGFVSHAPYWNWFGFPLDYVGATVADSIVGWTLAGMAVGRFAGEPA